MPPRPYARRAVCADEIDAIGTKRYEATSGGEREIQRTMLELLNQLDGFDSMGDVKVAPPLLECAQRHASCMCCRCCELLQVSAHPITSCSFEGVTEISR